jgi:hypothetical protein
MIKIYNDCIYYYNNIWTTGNSFQSKKIKLYNMWLINKETAFNKGFLKGEKAIDVIKITHIWILNEFLIRIIS